MLKPNTGLRDGFSMFVSLAEIHVPRMWVETDESSQSQVGILAAGNTTSLLTVSCLLPLNFSSVPAYYVNSVPYTVADLSFLLLLDAGS